MTSVEFERQVYNFIKERNLIPTGSQILLGVSGGKDSVALLRFFVAYQQALKVELRCVHVEHGIRGQASLDDQDFVKDLCQQFQIPCHCVSIGENLKERTKENASVEEQARNLRYEVLKEDAANWEKETGTATFIAVAHHMEDNIETILFQMARGTGITGVSGMPVIRGRIVRPFYMMHSEDIKEYLKQLNQDYCVDATNEALCYDRNRIRHKVLPELEKVNEKAVEHMQKTALLMQEICAYIDKDANDVLVSATTKEGELLAEGMKGLPDFMRGEVVHLWMKKQMGETKDIGSVHIKQTLELLEKQVGSQIDLPKHWCVKRTYQGLCLEKTKVENDSGNAIENDKSDLTEIVLPVKQLEQEKKCCLVFGNWKINFVVNSYEEGAEIPRNSYTKWFDYDKIKSDIVIRYRRSGDYLTVQSSGGKKKLKDYMIDEKIPAEKRDGIPLVCQDSHVVWVVGHRISETYKIDCSTTQILEMKISKEKANE